LTFAALGLSFAIWSESQAALLDGAFNLITALEDEYSTCNLDIVISRQEDYQR
jgi:hypothetical protein